MNTKPFALLRTKLHQPRLSADLVPRPHLVDFLNQNPQRPLTLISAPAGFGKTTLAVEWLHTGSQPVAWLSLDKGDDELRHFLRYLLAALQTIFPETMEESLSLLQGPELPPLDYLSTIFINELAAAPQPFILVLDDLHLLQTPPIFQFLEKVIDYLPEVAHLVLISRMDPPLPLARLRARGQMTEVRASELRFGPAEIAAFLAQTRGPESLSTEEIATLVKRTEGWAAGVRLASLSHRRPGEMASPTGTGRYAMSYLMDEVLAQQPAHIRAFLRQTAILKRFCGPLCEAVLSREAEKPGDDEVSVSSQEIITYLDQANLFVVSLDDEQKWYRYHHLFQELLRHRLQIDYNTADIAALHRRASRWLAGQGYIEEALDHALAAGEMEQAARLVEEHRHALLNEEQMVTLERWLARLPEALITQRPALLLARIWVIKPRYGTPAVVDLVPQVEALLQTQPQTADTALLWGELYALQSELRYYRSDGEQAIRLACQALAHISSHQALARGSAMMFLTGGQRLVGQSHQAEQVLIEALLHAPPQQQPAYSLRLYLALSSLYMIRADFPQMTRTAAEYLKLAEKTKLYTQISWANRLKGVAHYERNELIMAARHFLALTQQPFNVVHTEFNTGFYALAFTYQAQGHPEQASAVIAHLTETMPHQPMPFFAEQLLVRLVLLQGDTETARRLVLPFTFKPDQESLTSYLETPGRILAKLWLAQRTDASLAEAASLLEQLLLLAETQYNIWRKIEILAMQALVCDAQGERERALNTLAKAVTLAQPGSLIRTFVDLGPHLVPLLEELLNREIAPVYITQLLAAFADEPSASQQIDPAQDTDKIQNRKSEIPIGHAVQNELIEPLTDRELEILAFLDKRLSDKEIAQELIISPRTVKKHTSNIYQKLGVNKRRDAVARAAQMGLLSDH